MASMIRQRKPITINTFHILLFYWFKVKVFDEGVEFGVGIDELDFLLCHTACYFCLAVAKVDHRFVNF